MAWVRAGAGVLITISPMDLAPKGARWLIAVLEFHPQFPHIQPGGQFILHERGADGASFLIVADVLRQSMADALHDAAFRLNPGQGGVDGNPAVHNGHVVQNGDQAGLLIQLDLHMPTI